MMDIGFGYKVIIAAAVAVLVVDFVRTFRASRRKYLDGKIDRAAAALQNALRQVGVEIVAARTDYAASTLGVLLLVRGTPDHFGELTVRLTPGRDDDYAYQTARAIREQLLGMGYGETRHFDSKDGKIEVSA